MRTLSNIVGAAFAATLLLGPAACGWKSDGQARLDGLYHPDNGPKDAVADLGTDVVVPDSPDGFAADVVPADEGGFDLSPGDVPATGLAGLWAVRIVQLGEISPISDAYPITTPDYFLARVEPGAGQMSLTFCDEIPVVDTGDSGLAFVTSTTPALRDALGKVPVVVTLADSGASLPAQKIVWTWGLQNLAEGDPLPTSGTDAKVFDQDQDGNPGDTVLVEGLASGKRYMVKRAVWNLAAGTLSGDGTRLSGTLTYTLDEEPLGADPTMLDQKTPITPKDGSTYLLRRVGDLSCATLLQHVDEVFAP